MCLQCKNKIARVSYELMLTKTVLRVTSLEELGVAGLVVNKQGQRSMKTAMKLF